MKKLTFSTKINAPKEKVWEVMFDDRAYREWTEPFMRGSYFVGNWEQGSRMLFLAPDEEGKESGMVSTIVENKPYEVMSIKHLGIIKNGVEDHSSEDAEAWGDAIEKYMFKEEDGMTEVIVEMDSSEEEKDREMVEDIAEAWPKSLERLKEIAES